MHTVPTLCAASTVGIAAVGFSLGRPRRTTKTIGRDSKRRVTIEDGELHDNDPAQLLTSSPLPSSATKPQDRLRALTSYTPSSSSGTGSGKKSDLDRNSRRLSAELDPSTQSLNTRSNTYQLQNQELSGFDPKDSVSSRQSWIKRLSTLSQDLSLSSSLGPASPSISFSNTSTAPILAARPNTSAAPLAPNKLVKRSASQRATTNGKSALPPVARTQVPTLRRPATSHQRSATLQQQYLLDGAQEFLKESLPRRDHLRRFASSKSVSPARDGTTWHHYFNPKPAKLTKERPLSKRSSVVYRSTESTINRILPDKLQHPTLLMASSITTPPQDEEQGPNQSDGYDDNSDLGSSRAATPLGQSLLPTNAEQTIQSDDQGTHRRPRRSFSITDMFSSSSPSSWLPRSRSIRNIRHRRNDGNTGNRQPPAQLYSMPNRVSVSAHAGPSPQRRAITDPYIFRRESQTSYADRPDADKLSTPSRVRNASSPLPPLNRISAFNIDVSDLPSSPPAFPSYAEAPTSRRNSYYGGSIPPSSPPMSTSRPHRHSLVAPSDKASTLVGSDNENRGFSSGDDDDMGYQSETVFDSLRTGATGSSSGLRGPRIETIFDESPPIDFNKSKVVALQDLLPEGAFRDTGAPTWNGIVEEDETMSTPIRPRGQLLDESFSTPVRGQAAAVTGNDFPSSPPEMPAPLNLGKLEWDAHFTERDNGQWSFDDDEEEEDWDRSGDELEIGNHLSSPQSGRASRLARTVLSDRTNGSQAFHSEPAERDPRSSLFDWSEQAPVDKGLKGFSRPKTVHGKQDIDSRGGRPTGRRAPSAGLHIRSHSVPVVPDSVIQREIGGVTARFGSLGLGSKGVSEDWNEDFEFEGFDENNIEDLYEGGQKRDSGFAMVVPQAIKERQASVLGHLGHVKEFALLVDNLMRLRNLAVSKGIRDGPSAHLWDEADAIIALATLNDEDQELLPPRSPTSPNAGHDAFDDEFHSSPQTGRRRRKSVLMPDDDIFGGSPRGSAQSIVPQQNAKSPSPSPGRLFPKGDRQDTSAVARSLMETMHQRRTTSDPVLSTISANPQKKMPFDTTTLRDLVAHVGILSRNLSDMVRKADSASSSPNPSPKLKPTLSLSANNLVPDPATSSPSMGKSRPPRSKSNGILSNNFKAKENERGGHIKMMTMA